MDEHMMAAEISALKSEIETLKRKNGERLTGGEMYYIELGMATEKVFDKGIEQIPILAFGAYEFRRHITSVEGLLEWHREQEGGE